MKMSANHLLPTYFFHDFSNYYVVTSKKEDLTALTYVLIWKNKELLRIHPNKSGCESRFLGFRSRLFSS